MKGENISDFVNHIENKHFFRMQNIILPFKCFRINYQYSFIFMLYKIR
jgi:hypothetical protein